MAPEDSEDLYDEEFDFVDDDDDEGDEPGSDLEEEATAPADDDSRLDQPQPDEDEPVDEYGRPEQPPANYVVHVYEHKKFKRTIDRPFTPEDAEAFATEYNRASKSYGRLAVSGKNDAKPKKTLDEK